MSSVHIRSFTIGMALTTGVIVVLFPFWMLATHYANRVNNDYLSALYSTTQSKMSVSTDPETGCQYLIAGQSMIIRLDSNQKPMCGQ